MAQELASRFTGGISSLGIASGTTLLSGYRGNATVSSLGNNFDIAGATFFNFVNPTLAAYFGEPSASAWNGNFNISFASSGAPPPGFASSQVFSGDLVTSVPVPEPARDATPNKPSTKRAANAGLLLLVVLPLLIISEPAA